MPFYNIIFDFDGTLVDTRPGIVSCMLHALEILGIKDCNPDHIRSLIGKPLENMLAIILDEEPSSERVLAGVKAFRARYGTAGIRESSFYPGIPDLLEALTSVGCEMYIVTSKPTVFTIQICSELGISHYFLDIDGVDLAGTSRSKSERINDLIIRFGLERQSTLYVGDRADDYWAADENNICFWGASYGYGSTGELMLVGCRQSGEKAIQLLEWMNSH